MEATTTVGLTYDPKAQLALSARDIEYRRDGDTVLMARIYQPQGAGPFPAMIAVHGGAWANKEWLQNEPSHQRLAEGGLVVMAIQFRTSQDGPHPLALRDINYAIRWLKAHASEFNASDQKVGGVGWSSGGHQIMLSGMRPRQYADVPLPGGANVDATLDYVIMGWPVIDPLARYKMMIERGNEEVPPRHIAYFGDEAGMIESSPPHMLERGEAVELPAALLLQGAADESLPRMGAERFVELYSLAGGSIEMGKYPGEPHGFMRNPGPYTDRAFDLAKWFIARQVS
jgi:acetyl esterase/lipase